jgi:hypothetical protein
MVASGTMQTHIPVDHMMMMTSKLTETAVPAKVAQD